MKRKTILLLTIAFAIVIACSAFGEAVRQGLFTRVTLTFSVDGEEYERYAQPGDVLSADDLADYAPDDCRVLYWFDSEGYVAAREFEVGSDGSYTALLVDAEDVGMQPWLTLDGDGLAHPDEPISGEDMAAGVAELFGAQLEFDELAELDTVNAQQLGDVLGEYFRADSLPELDGDEPLTRIEAAEIIYPLYMTSLYGDAWGYDAEYVVSAPDLDPLRTGAGAMALCLDLSDAVSYAEGFVNLDGCLYRVDENGLFYMDAELDGLYYGPDGRYTSGNDELDALVAEILEPICDEYATREEMLRAAYLYVRDSYTYLRRNYYEVGAEGWQIDEAMTMLTTGRGNCYCYAATFWALARGLGFDATAVAGTVGWERSPHGWVIMYDDEGNRVTYDVELEMAYRVNRGRYDVDMYAMDVWKAAQWNYVYGEQYL